MVNDLSNFAAKAATNDYLRKLRRLKEMATELPPDARARAIAVIDRAILGYGSEESAVYDIYSDALGDLFGVAFALPRPAAEAFGAMLYRETRRLLTVMVRDYGEQP